MLRVVRAERVFGWLGLGVSGWALERYLTGTKRFGGAMRLPRVEKGSRDAIPAIDFALGNVRNNRQQRARGK